MAEFNPNAPTVLGNEWLATQFATEPVDAGSAWVQRLPSRGAETVESVAMSATGEPGQNGILHTLVEVIPEGQEQPGPVQTIDLHPSADGDIGNWVTDTDSATDLYQALQDPFIWPNEPVEPYIKTLSAFDEATFDVATSSVFGPAGALENARICKVQLAAIIWSSTSPHTFLTMGFGIQHQGTLYPSGSFARDANIFGETHFMDVGELNPVTLLPWTPADLAAFDVGGDWRIRCASSFVFNGFPAVLSFGLRVNYVPTENRAAVGSWLRTGPPPSGVFEVETDDLITVPDGTAGWSKPATGNFLYTWRQARSPILHSGQSLSKDTRWLRAWQDLGPAGNPPGTAFPPGGLRADRLTFDEFGLPSTSFGPGAFRSAAAIAPLLAGGTASEDGQPYRLTLLEFATLSSSQSLGQAVTPAVNASYAGVRATVVPPSSGGGTLTISVHQVAGGAQVGGTVSWTAAEVRAITPVGSVRYIEGFFDDLVPLVQGTRYEVRMSVSSNSWLGIALDASIGPDASFGGTTDGAFIGGSMDPDRDLEIALTIAPAEPTDVDADIAEVCVTTWACVDEVQHPRLTWTPGQPPLGDGFDHYDIQRMVTSSVPPVGGPAPEWVELARVTDEEVTEFVDHTAPRGHNIRYRIRAVGAGGAFSEWVESPVVTPQPTKCEVIFTSDQDPSLEVVYEKLPETGYDFLDHQADVVLPIYGADYQVAFFETEDRGVSPSFTLTVNFADVPRDAAGNRVGGATVFEPLRRITRSTEIPYVVVLMPEGDTYLAHVTLSGGKEEQPGNRYTVDVEVTPVTDTAVPAEF